MPKISVIIPVYNIKDYILRCLDSICSQKFRDIEIICVNDGSTDGSLEILQEYKSKDDRIIIIDKQNEGQGVARNVAMNVASGDYICFVDGDDFFDTSKDVFGLLYDKAEKISSDILIFGALSNYDGKAQNGAYSLDKLPKKYFNRVFSAEDCKKDIFKFPSTAWTKFYRRDFLINNGIKFQGMKVGEDQIFFVHAMSVAGRIGILAENLYMYRKNRKNSVMSKKKKNDFSPIKVFYGIEELLTRLGKLEDYTPQFVNRYFSKATSWLGRYEDDKKCEYFEEYEKLLKYIKEKYKSGWWQKFEPKLSDGYLKLKLKQFIAKRICL